MLKQLFVLTGLTVSLLFIGCDSDGDEAPTAPAAAKPMDDEKDATVQDEVGNLSLAGNWYYKHEVMKLSQSGTKVEGVTIANGFTQNPADPIVYPVPTVGSIDATGAVKLSELIQYVANPAKNYNIDKVSTFKGGNTLVLKVIKGQNSPDQVWTRK